MFALPLVLFAFVYAPSPDAIKDASLFIQGCGPLGPGREEVARKAVAGMAKLGFRSTGIGPDGHVTGYADSASVAVLVFTNPDGRIGAVVCAAGWTKAEAERVAAGLRSHLLTGPDDPAAPRQVGVSLPQAFRKSPPLRWQVESRTVPPYAFRYFGPVAALALEKHGQHPTPQGPELVMGAGDGRISAVFALPGANAVSARFVSVSTAVDEAAADRGCRRVLAELVKTLFE